MKETEQIEKKEDNIKIEQMIAVEISPQKSQ